MQAQLTDTRSFELTDLLDLVPTAVAAVGRRLPAHVDRDDLSSAGYLALVQAFPRAPRVEGEARAFLLRRVAGALRDELRRSDGAGRCARALVRRYRQVAESLEATLGREPTLFEVAERLQEPPNRLAAALSRAEAATAVADGEAVLAGLASDATTPLEDATRLERQVQVRALLAVLTPGQRVAVARTLLEDKTLDDVAKELGVTVARAGQLRLAALKKLRSQPDAARLWTELVEER